MSTDNTNTKAQRLIKFKTLDNNITEMTVDPDVIISQNNINAFK